MTEARQEKPKPKNLIPPSFTQAFLAGASSAAVSYVIGVPIEHIPRVAVAGAGYSLFRSWQDSRLLTAPKKKQGRQIPFSYGEKQSNINMELSIAQGGYITRESYFDGIKRVILGSPKLKVREIRNVNRPSELDEFVFYSRGLRLREKHVKLFLQSAWRNREYGKGLSARRWVRNFEQRPSWYRELSPAWYYAMIELLWKAGDYCEWHLIVRYDNSWLSLVDGDLRLVLNVLKWYEYDRQRKLTC